MNVFGQRIHWTESGSGAPVILLHGLGSDGSEWGRVTGSLPMQRRVIALDQIGFGQSGKPQLAYRIETLCSFLEGFFEALRLERASLVAHGIAGAVAIRFAAANPAFVERLVLVNTGFLIESRGVELLNPATRGQARDLAKLTRFAPASGAGDQLWTESIVSAGANSRIIESIQAGLDNVSTLLTEIAHPTLVVWGRADRLTPLAAGERIHSAIPQSQMVVLDKSGHAPHREQPVEFAAVVEHFLSGAKVHRRFFKQRQEENVWF